MNLAHFSQHTCLMASYKTCYWVNLPQSSKSLPYYLGINFPPQFVTVLNNSIVTISWIFCFVVFSKDGVSELKSMTNFFGPGYDYQIALSKGSSGYTAPGSKITSAPNTLVTCPLEG